MKNFFKTDSAFSAVVIRLALAVAMFPHGAQKALGWFGGYGFSATMNSFTEKMHIPAALAFLVILAEFGGAIALFFGFLTRLAAFGIGCVMVVAMVHVNAPNGFFMNWSGKQAGEGIEYHIIAAGIALALLLHGGGKFAVDSLIYRKLNKGTTPSKNK